VTLRDVLDESALDATAVADVEADGAVTWTIDGRPFAVLGPDGGEVSYRLDPVVAEAARRTPDTGTSPRGPEWVIFRPTELDGHAVDRAQAWFGAAARRARPGSART
jgi:hypothetical protein